MCGASISPQSRTRALPPPSLLLLDLSIWACSHWIILMSSMISLLVLFRPPNHCCLLSSHFAPGPVFFLIKPHNYLIRKASLSLFYEWENKGTDCLSTMTKLNHLGSDSAEVECKHFRCWSHLRNQQARLPWAEESEESEVLGPAMPHSSWGLGGKCTEFLVSAV